MDDNVVTNFIGQLNDKLREVKEKELYRIQTVKNSIAKDYKARCLEQMYGYQSSEEKFSCPPSSPSSSSSLRTDCVLVALECCNPQQQWTKKVLSKENLSGDTRKRFEERECLLVSDIALIAEQNNEKICVVFHHPSMRNRVAFFGLKFYEDDAFVLVVEVNMNLTRGHAREATAGERKAVYQGRVPGTCPGCN
jgi:hypothetical protein